MVAMLSRRFHRRDRRASTCLKQRSDLELVLLYCCRYMRAFKNGESTQTWDPESTKGDPNDPCLKPEYALDNYGPCCGRGNFEKAGHLPVCQEGLFLCGRRALSRTVIVLLSHFFSCVCCCVYCFTVRDEVKARNRAQREL